jgi:chromosomal replication initiator protein
VSEVRVSPWEAFAQRLRGAIPQESYGAWFKHLDLLDWSSQRLRLSAPNRYVKHWIETHYAHEVLNAARAVAPQTTEIELVVSPPAPTPGPRPLAQALPPALVISRETEPAAAPLPAPASPRSDRSLESFVLGPGNRLAHAACQAVAERPAAAYNPLLLCGGHGLGKTHLLQALARELQRRYPTSPVKLVSGEEFANAYLTALQAKKLDAFRQEYRRVHTLLVDDVQFLAGKEKTQDEFLHTFNSLLHSNRQIVLAATLPPREIPRLDPRLLERFQSGLLANLAAPDYETRLALLRAKAASRDVALPPEAAELLATRLERSVREMEGAVLKLAALSAAEGREPDKDLALLALRELGYLREGPLPLDDILAAVAQHTHVTADEIRGAKRHASLVRARHIAMYLAKQLGRASLPEIGRFFGNRDHSTVLHAVRKIDREIRHDESVRADVETLRLKLGR